MSVLTDDMRAIFQSFYERSFTFNDAFGKMIDLLEMRTRGVCQSKALMPLIGFDIYALMNRRESLLETVGMMMPFEPGLVVLDACGYHIPQLSGLLVRETRKQVRLEPFSLVDAPELLICRLPDHVMPVDNEVAQISWRYGHPPISTRCNLGITPDNWADLEAWFDQWLPWSAQ